MEKADFGNWRAQLFNPQNFSQEVPYDINAIEEKMNKSLQDLDHFNPYYYLSPIYDFTKFFGQISAGLSMGFNDITKKVNIMREVIRKYHPDINDIQSLVLKEQKSKLTYADSPTASRTFLRLLWFEEYLIHIFKKLVAIKDPNIYIAKTLGDAYNEVLAPRHPWITRKAVSLALKLSGATAKQCLKIAFNEDDFTPEAIAKVNRITETLEKLWKSGYDFYLANNLQNLA